MKSTVGIAILLAALQLSWCQRIKSLTACLSGQSLRVDCRYERKTENPVNYEFRLSKDASDGLIVASNMNVANAAYKSRTEITTDNNLVCLYLHGFTNNDEGIYVCKLKITNDYGMQARNVSVLKDRLQKCAGMSLLIQNTSWLLVLLLSLPLLQAVDFMSL
ncbi:thy-1 membrane glycoprotein [Pogona vitticeps]|uniref:Thy-1 membrane glycoprotein n=1 Tax=Pogona vitticeps TaxID=103695 RepID=A0ABM5EQD4_9SAUR|nr:thy-1 membrane glycoprotein [Pogona vitticeps]